MAIDLHVLTPCHRYSNIKCPPHVHICDGQIEAPDRQKKRNSMIRMANVSVGFVEVETHVKMQGNGRSGLRAQRGIVIMVWVDGDACGLLHVFCKEHM